MKYLFLLLFISCSNGEQQVWNYTVKTMKGNYYIESFYEEKKIGDTVAIAGGGGRIPAIIIKEMK